jgi:Limonene-1,2-epoxide hydrolase catalytic domain
MLIHWAYGDTTHYNGWLLPHPLPPLCFTAGRGLRTTDLHESPELSELEANVRAYAVTPCPCRVQPFCQFSQKRYVPLDSAVTSALLPKLAVLTSLASLGTMGAKDLAAFFTDDASWHNIPLAPVTGRDDIATTIASFTTGIESIEFRVRNIASDGLVVLTEQVDVGRQYGARSGVTYGSKMAGGRGLSRGPGRRIIRVLTRNIGASICAEVSLMSIRGRPPRAGYSVNPGDSVRQDSLAYFLGVAGGRRELHLVMSERPTAYERVVLAMSRLARLRVSRVVFLASSDRAVGSGRLLRVGGNPSREALMACA